MFDFQPSLYRGFCPGGGIGRRVGLKIQWTLCPCRFDPGLGYFPPDPVPAGFFYSPPHTFDLSGNVTGFIAIFAFPIGKIIPGMIKRLIVWILLPVSLTCWAQGHTEGYRINYTLHGVHDSMAWLCEVYGGQVTAIDSCQIEAETVSFYGAEQLPHGVYKIVFNDTLFTDIIFTGEPVILESRLPAIIEAMQVHGSTENKLLFDYWKYYFRIQDTLDDLIQKGREIYYTSQGKPSKILDELQQRADQLEFRKLAFIYQMMIDHPGLFAPKLIWSFQKPDYREYLLRGGNPYPSEKEFYRKHFFDRMNFSDPRMLHTEVLYVMINDYMKNFAQPPSSAVYIELIDEILQKAMAHDEVYQYCIELFIKNFEIGIWEKVFIHLVENHYLQSPLGNPTLKDVYRQRIQAIRNTSVGAEVPDVCGMTIKEEYKCLKDEMGTRTLLLIWSLGCDHCEAVLPGLVDISKEYSEKGLKIFSFSLAEEQDSLRKTLDHYGVTWTDVSDYMGFLSPVVDEFNVSVTPVMFLLDEKGMITDKPTSIPVLYANLVIRYKDQE